MVTERMIADGLTDDQIRDARSASMIDRDTYEAALYGDPDARGRVAYAINERNRRRLIEDATP